MNNPFYKTPQKICEKHHDYDSVNLKDISPNYLPRTNFVPCGSKEEYRQATSDIPWINENNGVGQKVTDFYRIAIRAMLSQSGERTLISTIIPPEVGHINGIRSYVFKQNKTSLLVLLSGLFSSIPFDFLCKTTGKTNLHQMLDDFPYIRDTNTQDCIILRSLLLNSLTKHYSSLWNKMWDENFKQDNWTKDCKRLASNKFKKLDSNWSMNVPLLTDFARRQALIETDVLTAISLGLSLDELKTIYRVQFPVLFKNERDTWYDKNGQIIFTVSDGITDVGLKRRKTSAKRVIRDKSVIGYSVDAPNMKVENEAIGWNDVKHLEEGVVYKTFMDDTQPGGPVERTVEFHAPFDRCDREEDYETAWKAFEKRGITSEAGAEV